MKTFKRISDYCSQFSEEYKNLYEKMEKLHEEMKIIKKEMKDNSEKRTNIIKNIVIDNLIGKYVLNKINNTSSTLGELINHSYYIHFIEKINDKYILIEEKFVKENNKSYRTVTRQMDISLLEIKLFDFTFINKEEYENI